MYHSHCGQSFSRVVPDQKFSGASVSMAHTHCATPRANSIACVVCAELCVHGPKTITDRKIAL
ncbi:hypothetical protein BVI434_690007 [Burkholderia vietnamiensis]|nr:hypothetical protein BVI434_690007 [Burkholderia vietnamiensis]